VKKREGNRGFTLIEVLVYMSVVAVLFTIVSISMQNQKMKPGLCSRKKKYKHVCKENTAVCAAEQERIYTGFSDI
jgi:prepilin-type cleavage/methylation N-terminal domain protein